MCAIAFAGWAVVPPSARTFSVSVALRYVRRPVAGQTITTHIWPAGDRGGRAAYAFETLNPEGKAVLLDGLAEVEKTESILPGHGG
jgi:hypothetical protein